MTMKTEQFESCPICDSKLVWERMETRTGICIEWNAEQGLWGSSEGKFVDAGAHPFDRIFCSGVDLHSEEEINEALRSGNNKTEGIYSSKLAWDRVLLIAREGRWKTPDGHDRRQFKRIAALASSEIARIEKELRSISKEEDE